MADPLLIMARSDRTAQCGRACPGYPMIESRVCSRTFGAQPSLFGVGGSSSGAARRLVGLPNHWGRRCVHDRLF
ncbi:hypothetical protein ACFPRL_14305 [Pseudoclavibacter helvolus]